MTRERMSRPSSSVPNQCAVQGEESRVGSSMWAGSCGAIQGAKRAKITKITTNTTPMAANGLCRAARGSEMGRGQIKTLNRKVRKGQLAKSAENFSATFAMVLFAHFAVHVSTVVFSDSLPNTASQ